MRVIKLLFQVSKERTFYIALSICIGILTVLSSMGMIGTSSLLVSKAALHNEVLALMTLIVGVRFFGISRGVLNYVERIFSHDATLRILSKIRAWTFKKFNENYFENSKNFYSGDIYTRLVNDVDLLKDFYLRGVYPLIIAVITGILTTIFLCFFSKELAFFFVLFYISTGFIIPLTLYRFNERFINYETNLKKEINIFVIDILKGSLEITIFSLEDIFLKRIEELREKYLKIQKRKNIINGIGENTHSLLLSILTVFSLVIDAALVAQGKMNGVWYAAVPLVIMASFEPLIPMSTVFYKIFETLKAGEHIYSLEDEELEDKKIINKKSELSDISVKNLTIGDKVKKNYIIKNVSFELPKGKKLAIVGESGAGKTSILKALLGFIKYDSGEISVGGISYSGVDIDDIRSNYTYVEQNPYMFNTSLLENLLIADTGADMSSIIKLIEEVGLSDLIEALPEKVETEFGGNFSGGQIQRLAIIRALLKPCSIVLLDEPTASMDMKLERKVINHIHNYIQEKSCVWVTHRLIEMNRMDEIIVLHKGEIVERGTHDELIKIGRYYYKLWTAQQQYIGDTGVLQI